MAEKRTYVSDGIFYGLMSWVLGGVFALGIAFAYAELGDGTWFAGLMVGGVVLVIAGWIFARFVAGGELPPPNTVKINPPPAPTVPRSRAAERRAAESVPNMPSRDEVRGAVENPPSAHDLGKAVGAGFQSAVESVKEATGQLRERTAEAISPAEREAAPAEDAAPAEPVEAAKPATLDAPREGGPDDLKRIKGIGPKLEETLHGLGYYHFDQIANWSEAEIAWVDSNLEGFNGRASRDAWVEQAKVLAEGGETEFSQRADRGEVY
jgi:predicted flap endonuclease-1-like 5' DNA nuclease